MTSVSIAIASIGRSSLAATLDSLDRLEVPSGLEVEVIVADDSTDRAARKIAERVGLRFETRVVDVASGNVAIARNACLERASGDFLAFIDDDEVAPPGWISDLVGQAVAQRADCLFAPVEPVYDEGAPFWLMALDPLFPEEVRTGRRGNEIVGRTGNSLLRRRFVEDNGLRFDASFGTGAEDLMFFSQCRMAGARMATTDLAAVAEMVPLERSELRHVLRTCFARGRGYARVMRLTGRGGPAGGVWLFLDSAAKLLACASMTVAALPLGRLRWTGFALSAVSNLGKMAQLVRG